MMKQLGIEPRAQKTQQRMHRLIDALRLSNGVIQATARVLGVPPKTVSLWCKEFEIEPRGYRMK
jgi:transcriptional regulator with GAF, ATPase, and Fis domain